MRLQNIHHGLCALMCLLVFGGCSNEQASPGDKGEPVAGDQETEEPAPAATAELAAVKATPSSASADKTPKTESQVKLKELPNAGKASASDGQSLADAKKMVDTMARELKRSTAAVVMAGKDKAKIDAIGKDFQKLNKTMTRQMESISERLTAEELVAFEEYTRVTLSPLINSLLQAFFSAGGLNTGGAGGSGATKMLAPKPAKPVPAPTTSSNAQAAQPTPVAAALGAGATGSPTPIQPKTPTLTPRTTSTTADSLEMTVAKGAIDAMVSELGVIVTRIRAADNDKLKLRQINKDYTAINQKHGAKLPEVFKALSDQEKADFNAYVQAKLMPVSNELVQAFTEAGVAPSK